MRFVKEIGWFVCVAATICGCATPRQAWKNFARSRAETPPTAEDWLAGSDSSNRSSASRTGRNTRYLTASPQAGSSNERPRGFRAKTDHVRIVGYALNRGSSDQRAPDVRTRVAPRLERVTAASSTSPSPAGSLPATLTVGGKTYQVSLREADAGVVTSDASRPRDSRQPVTLAQDLSPAEALPVPDERATPVPHVPAGDSYVQPEGQSIDLTTALALVGGDHPTVGIAQWRVQEAYAQLEQAETLWLPTLRAGFSYYRHDGTLQNSNGNILNVNRSSFQSGLGAGTIGAGITQRPGIYAQFHLVDAIFQPRIAEANSWAQEHAATAAYNDQLRDVALAYIDLLAAEQNVSIVLQSRNRTEELARLTSDFAETGRGLQSDADRMQTEVKLIESRLNRAREESETASARLAEALSADAGQRLVPADPTIVPIELVDGEFDRNSLISTGLTNRPELSKAQNLVASACEAFRREKYSPFVPSVLLGFSQTAFGGGLSTNLSSFGGRYDLGAIVTWDVRSLGFGERAARDETTAKIQQAKFEQVRTMDRVAREISEAYTQASQRRERIEIAKDAIQTAEHSYERNLGRILDGQGIPLEVLQSLQALEAAQREYLDAVAEFNRAEFQLQWSLGWPVDEFASASNG